MIHLNTAARFFRTSLVGLALLLTVFTLSSSNAYAGKDCSGAFTVTLSDGRTFSGKQTISVPIGSGLTAQVRGKFVEFTVTLDTFKVTNYTLTSDITNNRPAVIFTRKEPLHGKILAGNMSIDSNGEQLVLQRSGPGIDMKIQAKDCSEGGIFQMEPDQTIQMEHELGPLFVYCVDSLNRVLIVSGTNPFIGRESPETASLSTPTLSTIVGTKLSRWLIQGGGRMGLVTGEDAVEPLPLGAPPCAASPNPTPSPTPSPSPGPTPSPSPTPSPGPTPSPSPSPSPVDNEHCSIRFSAPSYSASEGAGNVTISVIRTCDRVRDSKVDFSTTSGTASDRSDFTFASGRLFFAPGETTKTFNVLIADDLFVEGDETLTLRLSDPGGSAMLVSPSTVQLTIVDNDTVQPTTNPIDNASFFVQQHYADFLNRRGDDGGVAYWRQQIENCHDDDCVRRQRINVSAAFFVETEFQETGSFVYRIYKAAFGRQPTFAEFMPDRSRVVDSPDLEANKTALLTELVERPAFKALYPDTLTPAQFVNKLMDTTALAPYAAERQQLIAEMNAGATRAQVLRKVIEMPEFKQREYNKAFVLMQYFGYLRRDPDEGGYQFWLDILNNKVPNNYRAMVCAFLTSGELQDRFSTRQTRNNTECGP